MLQSTQRETNTTPITALFIQKKNTLSPPLGGEEGNVHRPLPRLGGHTRRGDDLTYSDRPIGPTPYGKGTGREAVHNAQMRSGAGVRRAPRPIRQRG